MIMCGVIHMESMEKVNRCDCSVLAFHPPQNVNDMAAMERPDWQAVMAYITNIYKHFEVDNKM